MGVLKETRMRQAENADAKLLAEWMLALRWLLKKTVTLFVKRGVIWPVSSAKEDIFHERGHN